MPMQPLAENSDTAPEKDASMMKDVLSAPKVPEQGGPAGPEPTRYGDWERRGRCIDF